ncbi:glycosyltransferase family 4 protein [Engelhardtia mirabilis]
MTRSSTSTAGPSPLAAARALHLLDHMGVGGIARSAIELVRHARMDGMGDEIVLAGRPLDVDVDFAAPATPVHFLPALDLGERAAAQRLVDLAASRGARSLHTHSTATLRLGARARRAGAGLALLATLNEAPPTELGFVARRALRRDLRSADRLIAPSPELAEAWSRLGAEVELRLAAVDLGRFRPGAQPSAWRSSRGIGPQTLLVGCLLRATDDKDTGLVLDAIAELRERGLDVAVQFVGDGPQRAALVERARGLHWMHVRRRVLDVPSWYAMVDVVAFACEAELVPFALIEAMASGRAAVAVDPGGLRGLVGEAAHLVAPGNPSAYAEALGALAEPEVRSRLGRAARQRAIEFHDLSSLRAALAPAYHG